MDIRPSHPSLCPLHFVRKVCHRNEWTGTLTSKIAGDGFVLFSMIAPLGYRGKHVELDLICNGESGLLELRRHRQVRSEEKGARGGAGLRCSAYGESRSFLVTEGIGSIIRPIAERLQGEKPGYFPE
jgi:hypothetical protein